MKYLVIIIASFVFAINLNAQTYFEKGVTQQLKGVTLNEAIHNFGVIKKNIPVQAKFQLTNTSNQTLVLKNVKGSCHCTKVEYDKTPVAPGKTTTILATFDAKNTGDFHQTVYVTTNLSKEILGLKLKGTVK